MAKLFGFPINVEEDGGRGGGSSTNSRSAAQPDGDAMNSSAGFSESGPAPMDSESDLRSSFIDFFGRESHEMQRVSRGVDISGGFDDAMEEDEELLDILPGLGGEYHGDYFDDIFEPPPVMATRAASKRVVDELPVVEINSEELRNGKIACAICMGDFVVKEKVTRLPCWHYYHGECIVPWLEMKNTCPVCRFALPTDDL
ncbi:hypothetical protein IGI04_041367 [Brassica rapa subsp. trilocularis]|uniref:RING-type E3 ubiquitin transferase n=1 Tax=Brassica rapa subsp. trilocularis TaxID=1813537 RepID=A0ABQ7KRR0_BRACM|nr:hypothetical protein IGI04_041367 [Brassica rapa subsp. trilocularis]